jgi:hypothetical protein
MFGKNELINSLQKRTPQYSAQKSPKISDFWAFLRFILRGPLFKLRPNKTENYCHQTVLYRSISDLESPIMP